MAEQDVIEAAAMIKKYCQTTPCPKCAFFGDTCHLASVLPFAWAFEEEDDDGQDEQG